MLAPSNVWLLLTAIVLTGLIDYVIGYALCYFLVEKEPRLTATWPLALLLGLTDWRTPGLVKALLLGTALLIVGTTGFGIASLLDLPRV